MFKRRHLKAVKVNLSPWRIWKADVLNINPTSILDYEFEYENNFSTLLFRLHIITAHTHFITHELPCLPETSMKSEGSGNVTGLKFENRTRTQSRTRSPIRSPI